MLDIKTGSGAFITDPAQSLALARTMIDLGEASGCRTVALLTAMDRPLGIACGNALEVREAIAGLRGQGPDDLMEVTFALATEMLVVSGLERNRALARTKVEEVVHSGRALERFRVLVAAQGGDPGVIDDPGRLPTAPLVEPYLADLAGWVQQVEPRAVGHAIIELGGGRRQTSDRIDPAVGFLIAAKPGQAVVRGEVLAEIHAAREADLAAARLALGRAIRVGAEPPVVPPLVSHRVTKAGIDGVG